MGETNSGARPSGPGSTRSAPEAPTGLRPSGDDPSRSRFNVNHHVWVRLTDEGRAVIARRNIEFRAAWPGTGDLIRPKEDAHGWSQWQLWDLMHEFGPHVYNGCRAPFETIIQIEIPASGIEARNDKALEDGLRDLVALVANTGFHNSVEMAAARKLLTAASGIEAGTGETPQEVRPEGQEPVPSGDAQTTTATPTKGR